MFSRQENAIVLRIIHEEFEAIRDKGNIQLYMNTSQIINVFDKKSRNCFSAATYCHPTATTFCPKIRRFGKLVAVWQ
jgi:hypothetical protein